MKFFLRNQKVNLIRRRSTKSTKLNQQHRWSRKYSANPLMKKREHLKTLASQLFRIVHLNNNRCRWCLAHSVVPGIFRGKLNVEGLSFIFIKYPLTHFANKVWVDGKMTPWHNPWTTRRQTTAGQPPKAANFGVNRFNSEQIKIDMRSMIFPPYFLANCPPGIWVTT